MFPWNPTSTTAEESWCWEFWQTSGITWLLQVLQVRTLPVVQNRHTFMCSVPCKSLHPLAEFHISIMFSSVCSTETVGYVSTQEATWLAVNIISHTRRIYTRLPWPQLKALSRKGRVQSTVPLSTFNWKREELSRHTNTPKGRSRNEAKKWPKMLNQTIYKIESLFEWQEMK